MRTSLAIAQAISLYLLVLNGKLRGRQGERIDAGLVICFLVVLCLATLVGGWKHALAALLLAWVVAAAMVPLARFQGRLILGDTADNPARALSWFLGGVVLAAILIAVAVFVARDYLPWFRV
jgi:membrane protease YdiL (CAAX protease family)